MLPTIPIRSRAGINTICFGRVFFSVWIDLFDFESFHRRAGIGLVILSDYRNQGFGSKGLDLIENHSKLHYNLHMLYANVAHENKESIFLFKKMKYTLVGVKKKWNYYDNSFHDECLYQKILDWKNYHILLF